MAIQTNGNERMEKLDAALRGAQGHQVMAPAPVEQAIDDLAGRMIDTVAMLREIARYTSDYADNLQKGLDTYHNGIQRKLGKIGR